MRKVSLAGAVLATLSLCLSAGTAQAASNRVWVSGHGVDQAGCGTPVSPCRSLQYAHDNAVNAGGEIDILDPAGYGAINITKAVSIVNDGVGTAGVQASSGAAITINLPIPGNNQSVFLRGLNIDGVQQSGATGVNILQAPNVQIVNCVVRHFSGDGIAISSGIAVINVGVSNSVSSDNGGDGLSSTNFGAGRVSLVADHFTTENDSTGVGITASTTTGPAFSSFVISDLTASNNLNGMTVSSSAPGQGFVTVDVDSSSLSNNLTNGLAVTNSPAVHMSRLLITQNGSAGLANGVVTPGGVFSDGANHIGGNVTDISGPAPQADALN